MCFYQHLLQPIQTQERLWCCPLVHHLPLPTIFLHQTALFKTKFKHTWECSTQGRMMGITNWGWQQLKLSATRSEHRKLPKKILREMASNEVVKHHYISVIYYCRYAVIV